MDSLSLLLLHFSRTSDVPPNIFRNSKVWILVFLIVKLWGPFFALAPTQIQGLTMSNLYRDMIDLVSVLLIKGQWDLGHNSVLRGWMTKWTLKMVRLMTQKSNVSNICLTKKNRETFYISDFSKERIRYKRHLL